MNAPVFESVCLDDALLKRWMKDESIIQETPEGTLRSNSTRIEPITKLQQDRSEFHPFLMFNPKNSHEKNFIQAHELRKVPNTELLS